MPNRSGSLRPFQTAFWCVALALGLPTVAFLFGMVRVRQLQSVSNPRWAKFAEHFQRDSAKSPKRRNATERKREVTLGQAIEIDDPLPAEAAAQSLPQTVFTGSVTGRHSIEAPVNSSPLPPAVAEAVRSRSHTDFEELPPIIFRPLDEETESKKDSETAEATRRLEAQLTEVRQQLSQLTSRQHEKQTEDRLRETQLLDALAKLSERTKQGASGPKFAEISIPSAESTEDDSFDPPSSAAEPTFEPPVEPPARSNSKPSSEPDFEPTRQPAYEPEVPPKRTTGPGELLTEPVQLPSSPPVPTPTAEELPIRIRRSPGDRRFAVYSIHVENGDIRQVFARLSDEAEISICPSPEIQGRVSLNLRDVSIQAALNAIMKSQHYILEQEDQVFVVRTTEESARQKQQNRKLVMKIYQPNYLSANELNRLIAPLLSVDGRQSVSSPDPQEAGQTQGLLYADSSSQRDLVIVHDVPEVLDQIDQVLVDVDIPPLQVGIEAKILCVRLSEALQHGIDLSLLPCHQDMGTPHAEGGFKQGRLSCSVPTFIKSMERLADTSVVTSQRIQVLNKHRAEMLIGDRIGYQSQAGGEVRFMEAGTRLILRPSISADGYIRLEIHPERSSATLNKKTKIPVQNTTEMTTQVLVRNGATVAIGGLISEQAIETGHRLPGVGAIPIIGIPFRHKRDRLQRTELIMLVTPKILIDCENEAEGQYLQQVAEGRAAEFRDNQSHLGRHHLARAHYDRACAEFQKGNIVKAHLQIHASLRENKADPDALRLRDQIHACLTQQPAH